MRVGFTYDDVLIEPQWSDIKSRDDTNISTLFSRNTPISIPFVAANMDTVCDAKMCNAMYRSGGLGILHRNFSNNSEWIEEIRKIDTYAKWGLSVGVDWRLIVETIINNHSTIPKPAVVVLDVANAANSYIAKQIELLLTYRNFMFDKQKVRFDVVVGNIATASAAKNYVKRFHDNYFGKDKGIDGVKVGVGPGCFVADVEVLTIDGPKKIQDIKVGEKVKTHDGTYQKVIQTHKFTNADELIDIDGIRCTPNHEFYVINKKDLNSVNENTIHEFTYWLSAKHLDKNIHLLIEYDT